MGGGLGDIKPYLQQKEKEGREMMKLSLVDFHACTHIWGGGGYQQVDQRQPEEMGKFCPNNLLVIADIRVYPGEKKKGFKPDLFGHNSMV